MTDFKVSLNKRVLTIKTVIVMTLFPNCDLLLGTDFGDLYDAVHCFKRAQATLVDLWTPSVNSTPTKFHCYYGQ